MLCQEVARVETDDLPHLPFRGNAPLEKALGPRLSI